MLPMPTTVMLPLPRALTPAQSAAAASSDEDFIIFTVDEPFNLMGYLLSVPECIATAYYLSLCRPYELHDFIDALDWQNLSEDNFADLLRYSLPKNAW